MAVKHIQEYYNKISNDYIEMVHTLEELQECGVPNENIEQIRLQVDHIKENFQRWSYVMYLLNMPQRKEKQSRYERQNQKFLKNIDVEQDELSVNAAALTEINKYSSK